jgi:N6-adenosine-specific RNA methylase IME4
MEQADEKADFVMSRPLFNLISAQQLLAETSELLEGEFVAASLRDKSDARADRLWLGAGPGQRIQDLNALMEDRRKFGTIYADPPWQYQNAACRGAADNHYYTMSLDAIATLPVAKIAADEVHLHLWTTNGFLFEAREVMQAWGFTYKSCVVWIKPQLGNGNYWRVSHEFMLLGVRGNLTFADKTQQSWVLAERKQHSAKPVIFRKLIERVSPGPRLELFARAQVAGWTVWGNEIQPDLFEYAHTEGADE